MNISDLTINVKALDMPELLKVLDEAQRRVADYAEMFDLLVAWSQNGIGECWCGHKVVGHSTLCIRTRELVRRSETKYDD